MLVCNFKAFCITIKIGRLEKLLHWYSRRAFNKRNLVLKAKGYKYATTPKTSAYCHRLHKIGCYNLISKKGLIKPLYFRTLDEVEDARGKSIQDKNMLECQSCFK